MTTMDDQGFDDSIKKRLKEFEPEGFDPAAFADLQHRMPVAEVSFYSRYRIQLLTGSALALATLIILLAQWMMGNKNANLLDEKLRSQQELIQQLTKQISILTSVTPDTIYIEKKQDEVRYAHLLNKISDLEQQLQDILAINNSRLLKEVSDTPEQTSLSFADPEDYYVSNSDRILPHPRDKKTLRAEPKIVNTTASNKPQLSSKTIRDIEQHYHKGVGIKIGPAVEFSNAAYNHSNGSVSVGGGILADFILSPSLSLETGLKYVKRNYNIVGQNSTLALPNAKPELGSLHNVEIDSWIIETPVNVKYRYPLTLKTRVLASLGYSSFIFRRQIFDYNYEYNGDQNIFINSLYENKALKHYPGTINLSFGISHALKNKKTLETSLYYQQGIHAIGLEKNSANFFGLRTVYWIPVKE